MGDAAFSAALAAGVGIAAPEDNATNAPVPQSMSGPPAGGGKKHLPKCPMLYAWITDIKQLALPEPSPTKYVNAVGTNPGSGDQKPESGFSEAPNGAVPFDDIPVVHPINGAPNLPPANLNPLHDPAQNTPPPYANGQGAGFPPGYVPPPSADPFLVGNPKINPAPTGYSSPPQNPGPPVAAPQLPALIPLQLSSPLSLDIECHISTAFVTMEVSWRLSCAASGKKVDCLFALPMNHQGTVTAVEIDMGGGRMYATLVVPKDEAAGYGAQGSKDAIPQDNTKYNPELFRLTIPQVRAADNSPSLHFVFLLHCWGLLLCVPWLHMFVTSVDDVIKEWAHRDILSFLNYNHELVRWTIPQMSFRQSELCHFLSCAFTFRISVLGQPVCVVSLGFTSSVR
jgi:hypothetical protein